MEPLMRRILITIAFVVPGLTPIGLAVAQHHQPQGQVHGPAAAVASDAPFRTTVFGAFLAMMHKKDHRAKVSLDAASITGMTHAVGALTDLRGEVSLIDGKPIVTYGAPCTSCPSAHGEKATLLIAAKVTSWNSPIVLPDDLSGHALDRFIIAQARKAGLDMGKPFPLRAKGQLTNVAMHVIRAANPQFGGHGSGQPMALQEDIKTPAIEGEVVGFYAPEPLLGVITHPGEPFHYHWIDVGRTRTAHLDAFGMAKGTELYFPNQ